MARRLSRQMSTPGENEDRKENNHDFSFEPMEQWEGGVVVGGSEVAVRRQWLKEQSMGGRVLTNKSQVGRVKNPFWLRAGKSEFVFANFFYFFFPQGFRGLTQTQPL